jgi:hypothetical protein
MEKLKSIIWMVSIRKTLGTNFGPGLELAFLCTGPAAVSHKAGFVTDHEILQRVWLFAWDGCPGEAAGDLKWLACYVEPNSLRLSVVLTLLLESVLVRTRFNWDSMAAGKNIEKKKTHQAGQGQAPQAQTLAGYGFL